MRLYIKDIIIHFIQRKILRRPVSILMYHSIGENGHFFTVSPAEFLKQMTYLKEKGYAVASLADVVQKLSQHQPIAPSTVVLTFDDGYEDNFTNAYPVLKKFNFPATIFVSTDFIGTERSVRGISLKHLNEEQVREMHASGLIDIQPHGCSHRKLNELSSEEIQHEMSVSQNALSVLAGSRRSYFAYPYGALNKMVTSIAQKLFTAAVGVRRGYVSAASNALDLERQSIDSRTTFVRFKLKI